MENYSEIITQFNKSLRNLEELHQRVKKCEHWVDDCTNNCIQKQKIEEILEDMEDKINKAITEVEDATTRIRR